MAARSFVHTFWLVPIAAGLRILAAALVPPVGMSLRSGVPWSRVRVAPLRRCGIMSFIGGWLWLIRLRRKRAVRLVVPACMNAGYQAEPG